MEVIRVLRQNWLTRKPSEAAEPTTAILGSLVATLTWIFWNDIAHADTWMPASADQVFAKHEYWRLWTSLFAHADGGHLLSNAILFVPLSFFLTGYFGPLFFPLAGFVLGGLINVAALSTMAPKTSLIGISGLVYWMGAAWLTLYFLIGTKESLRRRLGKALFIGAALFAPQTFEPNVSYVAHFFGFLFGIPSAFAYYYANKRKFLKAEVYDYVFEDDEGEHPPNVIDAIDRFDEGIDNDGEDDSEPPSTFH
jgi:rhomboid protease GluP